MLKYNVNVKQSHLLVIWIVWEIQSKRSKFYSILKS